MSDGYNVIRWKPYEPRNGCCDADVNSPTAEHATGCTAAATTQMGAFVQWKGTDVCMDFTCSCGEGGHFDGLFAYTLRCSSCGRLWAMPAEFMLLETEDGGQVIQDLSDSHRWAP